MRMQSEMSLAAIEADGYRDGRLSNSERPRARIGGTNLPRKNGSTSAERHENDAVRVPGSEARRCVTGIEET